MAFNARVFLTFGLLASASWPSEIQANETVTLSFGVVPQQSASRLARIWVPILRKLGAQSGYDIKFATAKDIPTFEACLADGAYDIAYMNPYHYVVFNELSGYRAFARQKDHKLRGLLVTRKDNPIKDLDDLNKSKVAFPSPAAFGASVIPRAEIKARGISIETNYVNSHDSVYLAVASGLADAGGGVKRTWSTVPQNIRDQLRVFYQTDPYSPHAFAVKSTITDEQLTALLGSLENVDEASLTALGMKGIEAAEDQDWNDIRSLGLTRKQTGVVVEDHSQCHFE